MRGLVKEVKGLEKEVIDKDEQIAKMKSFIEGEIISKYRPKPFHLFYLYYYYIVLIRMDREQKQDQSSTESLSGMSTLTKGHLICVLM